MVDTNSYLSSFAVAAKQGELYIHSKHAVAFTLKKAHRVLFWICGILLSLIPYLFPAIIIWYQSSDAAIVKAYSDFQSEFISGGSFLWMSISMIMTTLIELLLNGFRHNLHNTLIWVCKIAIIVIIALVLAGFFVYFLNILHSEATGKFEFISWAYFFIFASLSAFINFAIVREV